MATIKRKTPLRKKRPTPRRRKTVVRLTGKALEKLREDCWVRDQATCRECGTYTFCTPRYAGDPLAYDMAHIKSRGAGGGDTLDNVRTLCHACHLKEHAGNLRPKEQ